MITDLQYWRWRKYRYRFPLVEKFRMKNFRWFSMTGENICRSKIKTCDKKTVCPTARQAVNLMHHFNCTYLCRSLPFYHIHPNPILFAIIKFYSTESVFKLIWIVCIELWEVYINFIWSRFGIGCHLLEFSINKRNQYGGRETLHR